jgi:hypothetical protein
MGQQPQVSATIDSDLLKDIEKLAEKEKRSVSSMVYLLLQQAVKEKTRKRRNVGQSEENNP